MLKKLLILTSLILTACGGGGGSDNNTSGSSSLRLTGISPAQLNLTLPDNGYQSASVNVTYSGKAQPPVYVLVEDPENIFTTVSPTLYEGYATLNLGLSNNLKAGTYSKDVKIHACTYAKPVVVGGSTLYECQGEFPGSPVTLKRNIVIQGLGADKTELNFTAAGATLPAEQVITLPANRVGISASWNTFKNGVYNGNLSSQFGTPVVLGNQIKIRPNAIAAGHYEAELLVNAASYKQQTIKVSYDVGPITSHGLTLQTTNYNATSTRADYVTGPTITATLNNPNTTITSITAPTWTPSNTLYLNWGAAVFSGDKTSVSWTTQIMAYYASAGTYTGNIVITTDTAGVVDTYTIPTSLTIN